MERKCAVCGEMIVVDNNNTHKAIKYKNKFYHFNCFDNLCDKRMVHKSKTIAEQWIYNKAIIDELVDITTREQQVLYYKDVFNQWLMQYYGLSFMSNAIYVKLDSVYKGTYKGLAYPIDPLELHNE